MKDTPLIKYVVPFVSVFLAVYISKYFNLCEYLQFVPDDIKFETCVTAYTGLIHIALQEIIVMLKDRFISSIQSIFYINDDEINIKNKPVVNVANSELSEIKCQINIDGNIKVLKKSSLEIQFPDWVDIQSGQVNSCANIDENRKCVIQIEKILPPNISKGKYKASANIKIVIANNGYPDSYAIDLMMNLKKHTISYINFSKNTFELRK